MAAEVNVVGRSNVWLTFLHQVGTGNVHAFQAD